MELTTLGKRGNVLDSITILVGLFVAVLCMVIMGVVINVTATALNADSTLPPEAQSIITHVDNRFLPLMDFWAVLFLVGLPLISAVLAYFNNIHPLFYWISIIFVILAVLWGASLSELWGEVSEDSTLQTSITQMPMADYILQNYGWYSMFVFVIIASGTFIKLRQGGGFV